MSFTHANNSTTVLMDSYIKVNSLGWLDFVAMDSTINDLYNFAIINSSIEFQDQQRRPSQSKL